MSFGVPNLHLLIYIIYRWRCGTPNEKMSCNRYLKLIWTLYSFPIRIILGIEILWGSNPIEKGWKGQIRWKKAFQVDDKKHLKFQTWHAEWIQGKISSFCSLPIWPFHPFSIGFDPPHNSISRIDPIGNEYKVQISYLYRLGLVSSFGVPNLHLYICTYIYIDGDAGRRTRKRALVDINN